MTKHQCRLWQPFCTIGIWTADYPNRIKHERFFIVTTNGNIRDAKRPKNHRVIARTSTMERAVSKALRAGRAVTFTVARRDFTEAQNVTVQLPTS